MKCRSNRGGWLAPAALALWLGGFCQGAVADTAFALATARETVETLHRGLIEVALEVPATDVEKRYESLLPMILATHDFPYIAELTVRRQWPDFSEAERADFIESFERLSVMTYASRFGSVSSDTFEFVDEKDTGEGQAEVSTIVRRAEGGDVTLDYMLHRADEGWKIVNIVADGVSDLALKRAEYRRILSRGTARNLVEYLDLQAADLK